MRDLTLSQEYLLCAVNEEGKTAPSGGWKNGLPGGGGAAGAPAGGGCGLWTKKYVTVTGPLPEGRRIYGPLYAFVNRPKADPKGEAAGGVHLYCRRCSAR